MVAAKLPQLSGEAAALVWGAKEFGGFRKRSAGPPAVEAAHAALAPCDRQRTVRGQIVDAIPIRERPAEVEDRAIPGHWEGDLLSGAKNSCIATLAERHSRFAMLIKVPSKETEAVVAALSQHVRKLPATPFGKAIIPIPLGELYGVWKHPR
jgi:hypothetical protein